MHDFRQLEIWQEAVTLARVIYITCETLPGTERYGLASQMRRAAISVSSNIAEGAGRGRPKEMARYLELALGSLAELDSQYEVGVSLGLIEGDVTITDQIDRIRAKTLKLHDRLIGIR